MADSCTTPSPEGEIKTLRELVDVPPFAEGGVGHMLGQAAEAYLAEYVYSTEDGPDYEPTEFERVLLEDFINGLLADERFFGPVRAILADVDGFRRLSEVATQEKARAIKAAEAQSSALREALERLAGNIEKQVPCTRAYLAQNSLDGHFADVLLSHYLDFAGEARQALSQEPAHD